MVGSPDKATKNFAVATNFQCFHRQRLISSVPHNHGRIFPFANRKAPALFTG